MAGMTRPWQERVAWHHIDGNPRNNDIANLALFHVATRQPLSDSEIDEYVEWLTAKWKARAI